jgi:hypothetical protein
MISLLRKTVLTLLTTVLMLTATGWVGPATFRFTPVARAGAASTYWSKWTVELDFANGDVNAIWTVFLGEYDADGKMVIQTKMSQPITCTPYGNFKIDGGEAIFDGASYLACAIPNYYDAVEKLLDGKPMPFGESFHTHCECVNPVPWVAVDLTLTTPDRYQPILYHVDQALQFFITWNADLATTHLLLNNGAALPQQLSWPVQGDGNQLWSGSGAPAFLLTTNSGWFKFLGDKFYDIMPNLSMKDYFHWANSAPTGVTFTHSTNFQMTSQPTTFLVGYDTHTHFVGKIRKLSWDPSCQPPSGL